jgi:hypothetical protein
MRAFVSMVVVGGAAVLGSYAWGVSAPGVGAALWGGVPDGLRPLYTVNMLLAASGFFPFSVYVLRLLGDPGRAAEPSNGLRRRLHLWYALILFPSALWLPLTAWMLSAPSPLVWALVRVDLALVALGALGVLVELARGPRLGRASWLAALVGLLPFCLQTVVLDALVWPYYFAAPAAPVAALGG